MNRGTKEFFFHFFQTVCKIIIRCNYFFKIIFISYFNENMVFNIDYENIQKNILNIIFKNSINSFLAKKIPLYLK